MKVFIQYIFLFCLLNGFVSPKECNILHSGKFQFIGQADLHGDIPTFTINGEKYVEVHEKGNYTVECTAKWINTCELDLTVIKVDGTYNPHKIGDKISISITKVEGKNIYFKKSEFGVTEAGKCIKVK